MAQGLAILEVMGPTLPSGNLIVYPVNSTIRMMLQVVVAVVAAVDFIVRAELAGA